MVVATRPHVRAARMGGVRYVASLDNVATQMAEDDSFDKEEAYRKFESLLGDADVTFEQGDKVRKACGRLFRAASEFVMLFMSLIDQSKQKCNTLINACGIHVTCR